MTQQQLEQERNEIMEILGIHFDAELDAEGSGYEVPAEPEPDYFATLPEAVKFWAELFEGEIKRLRGQSRAV